MSDPAVDPALAAEPRNSFVVPCLLAWLFPGLGHFYLGKRGRAVVFFCVVAVAFVLGIGSDGAASLIDPRQPLSYLATFDNLAMGPLDLVSRRMTFHQMAYRLPADESGPHHQELIRLLRERVKSPTYEYGNTFLLTAGLMNILLILDAFDIATGRKDRTTA